MEKTSVMVFSPVDTYSVTYIMLWKGSAFYSSDVHYIGTQRKIFKQQKILTCLS